MDKKRSLEDVASFSALFDTHHRAIFGYILRRTGNVADSADIAADTFYKAWMHLKRFSYRGVPVKVWLYRIATNEVNQYFRHQQRHRRVFGHADAGEAADYYQLLIEDRAVLEAELQGHEQYLQVLQHLKTLPVKYQEVLALRYFEGKSNKDIAEILGAREGTIKSLLSRGVEKLREKCHGKTTIRGRIDPDEQAGDSRA